MFTYPVIPNNGMKLNIIIWKCKIDAQFLPFVCKYEDVYLAINFYMAGRLKALASVL